MAQKSPGIMIYFDDLDAVASFTDAQFGLLIRCLAAHGKGEAPEVPPDVAIPFNFMAPKVSRDIFRYGERCKKNQQKMLDYWERRRADALGDESTKSNQNIPSNTNESQSGPKVVTVTVKETETVKETVTPKEIIIKKDTYAREDAEKVLALAKEKGITDGSRYKDAAVDQLIRKYGPWRVELAIMHADGGTLAALKEMLEKWEDVV